MLSLSEVQQVVDEWKVRRASRPPVVYQTLSDLVGAAAERAADDEQARRRATLAKLLDALVDGAHAIEDGARLSSVRAIFKNWVSCTVGYSAPGDVEDRERAYDVVIRVVDDVLGAAESERLEREAELARREEGN